MTRTRNSTAFVYPNAHDIIHTADDLTTGDAVCVERISEGAVLLHAVARQMLDALDGPLFVLLVDDGQTGFRLQEVSHADVE